jgi:hypothetical protein
MLLRKVQSSVFVSHCTFLLCHSSEPGIRYKKNNLTNVSKIQLSNTIRFDIVYVLVLTIYASVLWCCILRTVLLLNQHFYVTIISYNYTRVMVISVYRHIFRYFSAILSLPDILGRKLTTRRYMKPTGKLLVIGIEAWPDISKYFMMDAVLFVCFPPNKMQVIYSLIADRLIVISSQQLDPLSLVLRSLFLSESIFNLFYLVWRTAACTQLYRFVTFLQSPKEKWQTMIYKILHRTRNIEQHEPIKIRTCPQVKCH